MIIIPSGKPKIWDKTPDIGAVTSNKAYTGNFHRLCKEYALIFDKDYVILSPYYGFLKPTDIIPTTYNVRFTQKGTNAETIALDTLKTQWKNLKCKEQKITVLGGKKFKYLLENIIPSTVQLTFPLIGVGGIGYMQQPLKHAIETGKKLP